MKDFILAALPLVMAGLALAIICASLRKKVSKEDGKKLEQRMALGMSLGLLFGAALNNCGLWGNHALGLVMGPLWGMALASLWKEE